MELFHAGGQKRQRRGEDEEYGARGRSPCGHSNSCKRGSGAQWTSTDTIFNTHGVTSQVSDALSMIFTSAELSLASGEGKTIVGTLMSLLSGQLWLQELDAFRVDSLDAIATRCMRTETMELGLNFISMINMIQFVTKIERLAT